MRFYPLRNWINKHLNVNLRVQVVCLWYVLSLMVETRKHSLAFAESLSGLNKSQFCRFLQTHHHTAVSTLDSLSKRQAKQYAKAIEDLEALPWKIAILIDATDQQRSSLHADNVQKFNHGKGYVIGHQWTNIVLILNGILIPLPPIPFYTKTYCRENGKPYLTEHERLVEYLNALDLDAYIGPHRSENVVVLADSGYDDKKIEKAIIGKNWQFIFALKSTRSVKSQRQYESTPKYKDWHQVAQFFKDQRRLAWQTVRIFRILKNGSPKKRMEFRIRQITGFLKDVGEVQLVCSEFKKRSDGRRKYLACTDLKVTPRQILIGYRLRWRVEIFHKTIKMHMGFEDVATTHFHSISAHVHWVYCAYILMHEKPPGVPQTARTIPHKQRSIREIIENQERAHTLQVLTQSGGLEKHKNELKSALAKT